MDVKNPNKDQRTTPEWAEYQRKNFWTSNEGVVPPFNTGLALLHIHQDSSQTLTIMTEPGKLEELAKEKLTEGGWYYASSNAGQSYTHLANRQAFYRHKIIPRMLVDTNKRDTSHEIWGHKTSAPIGFSPIGINKIYHPLAELPVAKVAKELNLPYCLSTAGSTSIEDVGKANGKGTRFFQLYMPHDDELTVSLLKRAVDSGFTACILTVDTWQLGWRHDDVYTSNYAFYHGQGADLGLTDPVFQKRLAADGIDPKKQPNEAGAKWIDNVWHGRAWDWSKIPWLIKTWKELSGGKPFAIKGIQSVQDARKCVEVGCDGIVVSNHAGRQVDGAIASLDALERIVDAVGDKTYIMFDSGIRGAADVAKALALGARFVFVGRLWVWGLSIMGEQGVRHVMKSLLADLDILFNVAGVQNVNQLDRSWLDSQPKGAGLIAERSKL
ncbi:putative lactate 2-monooxygenase [Teratosphaeria destructans]|uniref:Lactate 2-monooxygenase n=1 Tax=Teratosphaeria destructans TaxID=418781 RepID=A0A9W7VZ17_9PEZI|nr:putative lactate 2-monooxygenase [Teratosphaeria destructans]